jgi:hypothetical protein
MAKHVLKDAVVTVAGSAISNWVSSVTLEDTADEVDFTGFGSGYREIGQGLKDATITCTVFNDYDAGKLDAIVNPLYASGGTFAVTVKASSAATSGSNPIWTMVSRVFSYSPVTGAVGDANTSDLTFRNAGTAGLTRGTS